MPGMRATAAAILLALTFGACGSSDRANDTGASTRAQFIARTDRLCRASNERTRALNVELQRAAARARDDDELLRRLAPILRRGYAPVKANAAAFDAAEPPADDAAAIERIRVAYDQQARLVRRLAAAARRGDVDAIKSLSTRQRGLVLQARRLARAYGFRECGSSESDPS
jgi:hypothetical protein